MILAGVAGFIKDLVGLVGGQALVPQVNGKAGQRAQIGCEGLRFGRLWAVTSGEVNGIADNDGADTKAACQPG